IQVPVVAGFRSRNTGSSCAGVEPPRLPRQNSNSERLVLSARFTNLFSRVPGCTRTDHLALGRFIKERDVFNGMSVGVGKVNLRRWHPADDRWFRCNLPRKISRNDAEAAKA